MNIKYRGEEYTLISENSGMTFVHLTFAKKDSLGVSLITMNYYYFGDYGDINTNWIYLPYMTLQDLLNAEKTTSDNVAP